MTRGAGAFAYSYTGNAGLEAGQLVAVPFQHRLELGLIVELDPEPPEKELLPLVPIHIRRWPGLGGLLLQLCELSMSAPDEIAGHLLFDSARKALRLQFMLDPERLTAQEMIVFGPLAGQLKPAQQKLLVKSHWPELARLARDCALRLEASVAGDPDSTRAPAQWRRHYALAPRDAALLGLPGKESWPGSYLAGFDGLDLSGLPTTKATLAEPGPAVSPSLLFSTVEIPQDWNLDGNAEVRQLRWRQARSTWPALRAADGLVAELSAALNSGQRILVVTPQAWMLERLWPLLAPLAAHVSRFRSEAGSGVASQIIRTLELSAHVVVGGAAAWKLAAHYPFDRVILIDPTHPQYAPERTPHLDPRLALLQCAARAGTPTVDLIHLGLDALSGLMPERPVKLHVPYEPPQLAGEPQAGRADTDPLPLELRTPDKRRLIYFNRLGSGRGLYCAECWAAVSCPRCGSAEIHFSASSEHFECPDCRLSGRELRCPRCHLMTLAAVLPGLEAVTRRPGDLLLHGPAADKSRTGPAQTVIGTAQLLDPLPGFWPEEIVYVHAEGRVGLSADWPEALDAVLRLAAIYDNPDLRSLHIVSGRLVEQFGIIATAESTARLYSAELELRGLAGLPPHGALYHLRAIAARPAALDVGRRLLGEQLQSLPGTTLLRLGSGYRQGGAYRLGGWLINPQVTLRDLQALRWLLHRQDVTLTVRALRGPWIW